MKKNIVIGLMALTLLASCNKEKTVIKSIQEYNATMQDKGYHFGDKIALPSDVTGNAESISISFFNIICVFKIPYHEIGIGIRIICYFL